MAGVSGKLVPQTLLNLPESTAMHVRDGSMQERFGRSEALDLRYDHSEHVAMLLSKIINHFPSHRLALIPFKQKPTTPPKCEALHR